jgi:hypothetical protein
MLSVVAHMCNFSYLDGRAGGLQFESDVGKSETLYEIQTKSIRDWGV